MCIRGIHLIFFAAFIWGSVFGDGKYVVVCHGCYMDLGLGLITIIHFSARCAAALPKVRLCVQDLLFLQRSDVASGRRKPGDFQGPSIIRFSVLQTALGIMVRGCWCETGRLESVLCRVSLREFMGKTSSSSLQLSRAPTYPNLS